MGYYGDFADSQLRIAKLSSNWRYLMCILIMCISSRKAGYDGVGHVMQSAMVALTLNKPYNFSKYVFDSLKDNIVIKTSRFLLYPRFVQILLNALIPNLQADGAPLSLTHMNKRILADCRQYGRSAAPATISLFGHIVNAEYVASADDYWEDQVPAEQVAEPQAAVDSEDHVVTVSNNREDEDVGGEEAGNEDEEVTVSDVRENEDVQTEVVASSSSESLISAALAALQIIKGPRQASKRPRTEDSESEYEPEVPLQRRRRQPEVQLQPPQVQPEVHAQPKQRRKMVIYTGQSSTVRTLPTFSQLVGMVQTLQAQIQTMQTTINSQQARIISLEVEVEELKAASAVHGENVSGNEDGDDDSDGSEGGSSNGGEGGSNDDNDDPPPPDYTQNEPLQIEPLNAITTQEVSSMVLVVYEPPLYSEDIIDIFWKIQNVQTWLLL